MVTQSPCGAAMMAALVSLAVLPRSAVPVQAQTTARDDIPAGPLVHEVWTVEDGLPVNSINGLLQSRTGYIWAATFDGLVRFDGVRFTVYNAGNSEGLPSNRIVFLTETSDGSLWLRSEQGHLVQLRDGEFTHYGPDRGIEASVLEFYEDRNARVWVGTSRGLGRLEGGRFVPVAAEAIRAPVPAILERRDGTLWVGTDGAGVFRLDGMDATAFPSTGELARDSVGALHEDAGAVLWIGTARGAYRHSDTLEPIAMGPGSPDPIFSIAASPSTGAAWMLGLRGVYRIGGRQGVRVSPEERRVVRHRLVQVDAAGDVWYASGTALYRNGAHVYTMGPRSPDTGPTSTTEISAFLLDREGSIWVGTNESGLHRLKPSVFTVYSEAEGLSSRNAYPVLEDRSGNIWVGTLGGGLSRVTDGAVTAIVDRDGIPASITSLLVDREGRLWVGGQEGQLAVCSLADLDCARREEAPLRADPILAMHEDHSGSIWLAAGGRLFRGEPGGWSEFDAASGVPTQTVRVFLETRDGALWMGTNGAGLTRYEAGRFTSVTEANGLPSNLIRSLYQDDDGWLWIGTEGRGLARLDPRQWGAAPAGEVAPEPGGAWTITSYRAEHGLFDEVIHQILEDDAGRLWMSTNRGIFWVLRDELNAFAAGRTQRITSTVYTERQGLRNREANGGIHPAGARAQDGRLWFPTQDGVAVVDPRRTGLNPLPPPVVVERVTTGSAVFRPREGSLDLDVGQRDLEIDYTALSFLSPENVRFRYRLEGYDRDWIAAGTRRTAYYTRVPPGRYTFRVIASNDAGVWNEEGAVLALRLAPAFHETRTFTVLLAITLVLGSLAAFRWRMRVARLRAEHLAVLVDERTRQLSEREQRLESQNARLEAQAMKLAELDQAKSRFFANVSHEFRTPLTLTIGPLEDLRARFTADAAGDDDALRKLNIALRNSRRLLRLVNQVLDAARLESGAMRLTTRPGNLATFLRGIASSFASLAEREGIAFEVRSETSEIPLDFDADALEKVFMNLLSNAFKFTPEGGRIEVVIERDGGDGDGAAVVHIADSGSGIPAADLPHVFERFYRADESRRARPGTGIGLSLVRELVELHGGTVAAESRAGEGTTFTVRLPLGDAHLATEQQAADAGEAGADPAPGVETPHHEALAPEADEGAVEAPGPDDGLATPATGGPADVPDDVTTVLVVDDSTELRAFVREHLAARYRVAEASDGAEGLALACGLLPDLVISDLMMPEMDGHELCQALRESPETDFIPIILLTARADREERIAGLEGGADDYVVKPFDMKELEARADNLIASRRRLRERYLEGSPLELRARTPDVSASDAAFIERVRSAIEANLSDGEFGVAELAQAVFVDRSHMYRRIQALFGETPTDLIRRLRIERAARLLADGSSTVAEIAYAAGFNSVSYFHRCFRTVHGVTPAAYRDEVAHR
jgi:signal transduction histidine kinase/ligand-binding sensor domain-containing protein/DNA-binding response OmpR family regulator